MTSWTWRRQRPPPVRETVEPVEGREAPPGGSFLQKKASAFLLCGLQDKRLTATANLQTAIDKEPVWYWYGATEQAFRIADMISRFILVSS